MFDEEVRQAFKKVKEDISFLSKELFQIRADINRLKIQTSNIIYDIEALKTNNKANNNIPTHPQESPTDNLLTPTFQHFDSNNPTDNQPSQALGSQNIQSSIGNEGVPTNKQTNKQTNQHTSISSEAYGKASSETQNTSSISQVEKVSEILESLDSIKKDLRLKFKRLTKQEMLIFSTIYSLEESEEASYTSISKKLSLSESSIRDYTNRLLAKGAPIIKEKLDNKRVLLHISPELRKIASLDTILKLRQV